MIVVSFWTLNTSLPPSKMAEVGAKLMQKGLFPPKNSKPLAWYVCTGGRGVTITEIEGADANEIDFENWQIWLKECPGIFTSFESYPAVPVAKAMEIVMK